MTAPQLKWAPICDKAKPGERCACCNRELYGHAIRLLELDQRDGTYHDRQDIPVGWSQGWFPFGLKCAKRIVANGGKIKSRAA